MSRRVKLPGASELFRPTGTEAPTAKKGTGERSVEPVRHLEEAPPVAAVRSQPAGQPSPVQPAPSGRSSSRGRSEAPQQAGGTGRVRHEEKITVYVSREELLALEQARLRLRADLGLAVDRGRLVRAAIAYALADLETAGEDGELVRRLTAS